MKMFRVCAVIYFAAVAARAQVPQLIAFQGRLLSGSNLVSGVTPISLRLFNAASGGAMLYEDSNNVAVADGLYSTFIGDDSTGGSLTNALAATNLYLEVMVNGTALSPRERVASVVYALEAGVAQGVVANGITLGMIAPNAVQGANLAPGAVTGAAIFNGTITPQELDVPSFSNTFWKVDGNSGTAAAAGFVGTSDNQALEFKVNGSRALRLEPNATCPNVVGGAGANTTGVGVAGAAIGGGSGNRAAASFAAIGGGISNAAGGSVSFVGGGSNNVASGSGAVVAGGEFNKSSGTDSTVAGGSGNSAAGMQSTIGGGKGNLATNDNCTIAGGQQNYAYGQGATVGGGWNNIAIGNPGYGTVAGGQTNAASGSWSAVGGGYGNVASGPLSAVPGGYYNVASSTNCLAAGFHARASHPGSFVWSDLSSTSDTTSTNANAWTARCVGGARFITAVDGSGNPTAGIQLSPGASAWSNLSDKNAKENFASVDSRGVLEKVAAMPVTEWNLKSQNPSIHHVGPMAQDFRAAFGLGESERYINSSDADGVAFAAIQGLYGLVRDQRAEIEQLKHEIESLKKSLRENKALP